jgi:hypothetical protein
MRFTPFSYFCTTLFARPNAHDRTIRDFAHRTGAPFDPPGRAIETAQSIFDRTGHQKWFDDEAGEQRLFDTIFARSSRTVQVTLFRLNSKLERT